MENWGTELIHCIDLLQSLSCVRNLGHCIDYIQRLSYVHSLDHNTKHLQGLMAETHSIFPHSHHYSKLLPCPESCSQCSALTLQELSQWRQQQLQESLRNSVLDEEAAAKFSTAAALAAKEKRAQRAKANYDKGLLTAVDTEEKVREVSQQLHPLTPS